MAPTTSEALRDLLAPVVEGLGYELDGLSVTPAGRRRVVRVTVDGDTPVDLDTVADISRALGSALDGADAFGSSAYVLEVGSPGVERPLTEARHWRRAVGRLVEVTPPPGAGGAGTGGTFTGRLLAVVETGVVLDVEGTPREVGWTAVGRARVQVEFRRTDGPDPDADGPPDPGDEEDDGDDLDDGDDGDDLDEGNGLDEGGSDTDHEDETGHGKATGHGNATDDGHGGGEATWTST